MPVDPSLIAPADPQARDALLAACAPGRLLLVAARTGAGGAQMAVDLEHWLRTALPGKVVRHEKQASRDIGKIASLLDSGAVVISVCFLGLTSDFATIPAQGFAPLCGRLAAIATIAPGAWVLCPACARPATSLNDSESDLLAQWGIAAAAARRPGPGCPVCVASSDRLPLGVAGVRSTMPFCAFDDATRALPPEAQMSLLPRALAPRSAHERMQNALMRDQGTGPFPWSGQDDLRARVGAGLLNLTDALLAIADMDG